jgi:hypothetical protein
VTAVQPPLFLPGWDIEPCDTAPPPTADEQSFTDIHGPQPQHRAYRTVVTVRTSEEYL